MADVFISYAREDQDFVRRLQDALEEHNRNTWIDWKDIPLTAKWKEEVFSAIDQADSFAAVISPDFIVSKPCQDELDHAAHNHKRMVPLWHRDVDDEEVPPDLAARQYVYLREKDDFLDEVRPTSSPSRLSVRDSDRRRLVINGRKDQREAAHLPNISPIRPKFIGNSSASALLMARRRIRVLREKGKPAMRRCPHSPKGLLGMER
jgi:hypothetical protein